MAAPTFVAGTQQATFSAVSLAASEPAGAAQNDVLLYWVLFDDSQLNFSSGPSGGWTLLNTWTGSNGSQTRLYGIVRGASAPGYTFTCTGTNSWIEIHVSAWRGCNTASYIDASTYNATTTRNPSNPNCGSVTTTGPDRTVVALGMGWNGVNGSGGWTGPSGYSTATSGSGITNADCGVFYVTAATAGAYDPGAFSGAATGLNDVAEATVALLPKDVAAGPSRSGPEGMRQAVNRASTY